ncbi:hypothetical protein AAVH_07759 [Aphelenchoides avenae]|nr:hypothetical protein AAVH_07759 [Aphelenchus avenae]
MKQTTHREFTVTKQHSASAWIPQKRLSSISESEDDCRNEAQEKETTVRYSYVDCDVLELSPWILVDTFPNRMVRKIAYGTQTNPTHGPLLDKSAQSDTIEKQSDETQAEFETKHWDAEYDTSAEERILQCLSTMSYKDEV